MGKPKQLSFRDHRMTTGRGGPRRGAGRPRGIGGRVAHRERAEISRHHPVHVTMRVLCDLPSLRTARVVRAIRRVLSLCCERGDFRLVHYSVQANHLHLIVEAHDKAALARGMKSVGARIARALNRVFGRKGAVLDGRYHAVALRSPQQVWRALRYVLLNVRHHAKRLPAVLRVDPASSGRWFAGWQQAVPEDDPIGGPREVADARTWLLQTGWSRHGPISLADVPG